MPIFDFECMKCGHVVEKIVSGEASPPACPKCEGPMKKLFSASGQDFRLYGEGFHKRSHKDTGDWNG